MAISTGAAILGSAGLGLLGGSKKAGNTTSTQTNTPWAPSQPYLLDLFSKGQQAANSPSPMYGDASNQLRSTIQGDYLNPQSNPFLGRYVNDALGMVKSNFAGQYGGQAGSNLGNSGYQEMLTRTLANTALPIYADAYNQERQNQLQASQLAPAFSFAPLDAYRSALSGAGGYGTQTSQQPYFTNPLGGALGGALAGGQLAGMMNKNPFTGVGAYPY